jgi:hypothetical protein
LDFGTICSKGNNYGKIRSKFYSGFGLYKFQPATISHGDPGDILILARKYSISPDYWKFDPYNREIDLFTYRYPNMSAFQGLENEHIGAYPVHVFNETESGRTETEVYAFVAQLKKNPDYQIDNFGMVTAPDGPYAELWCNRLTPEN